MSEGLTFVDQSDVQGRLRLFRYGIIVAVVVVFLITWLVPYVFLSDYTATLINTAEAAGIESDVTAFGIGDSLLWGVLAALATAVIGAVAYFVYREVLNRTVAEGE